MQVLLCETRKDKNINRTKRRRKKEFKKFKRDNQNRSPVYDRMTASKDLFVILESDNYFFFKNLNPW